MLIGSIAPLNTSIEGTQARLAALIGITVTQISFRNSGILVLRVTAFAIILFVHVITCILYSEIVPDTLMVKLRSSSRIFSRISFAKVGKWIISTSEFI